MEGGGKLWGWGGGGGDVCGNGGREEKRVSRLPGIMSRNKSVQSEKETRQWVKHGFRP